MKASVRKRAPVRRVLAGATEATPPDRNSGEAGEASTSPLILSIPTPPSLNNIFGSHALANGKSVRHETKSYIDWQGSALWRLNQQKPKPFQKPVVIFGACDRMAANADIDNRIKPILDVLKTFGLYADDNMVTGVAFVWAPTRNGMTQLLIAPAQQMLRAYFHPANQNGATGGWFVAPNEDQESDDD